MPTDSVKAGNVCVDTYEGSVWQIPPSNAGLTKRVKGSSWCRPQLASTETNGVLTS